MRTPARVFDRLVSAENLARLVEAPLPAADKLGQLRVMFALRYATFRPALSECANNEIATAIGTLAARQSDPALRVSLKRLLTAISDS